VTCDRFVTVSADNDHILELLEADQLRHALQEGGGGEAKNGALVSLSFGIIAAAKEGMLTQWREPLE
jgi:hypothetical protein